MDINEIQQYLETNKDTEDVKAFVGKLSTPTLDGVKGFLETNEDGKKYFQSATDAKVTKGIETFKTNNLQKLIDEEVKKRFPDKDQKDIEIENLKAKFAEIEAEKAHQALKNKALELATAKKIPLNIVDLLIGKDETATIANVDSLENAMKPYIQAAVEERIKSGSYTPPKTGGTGGTITKESIKSMSMDEINKNWDVVQKVLAENNN